MKYRIGQIIEHDRSSHQQLVCEEHALTEADNPLVDTLIVHRDECDFCKYLSLVRRASNRD